MIDIKYRQLVTEVIERHFKDAPKPDGSTETNLYLTLKENACKEIYSYVESLKVSKAVQMEMFFYAEDRAQNVIDNLLPSLKRNPKRYK